MLSHPLGMMHPDAEHPAFFLYHAPVQSDPAPHRAGPRCHRVHREVLLAVRAYELMIIADGELEESAVSGWVNQISAQVEAKGGSIATTDKWGKRRFAYEINHKWEGIYVVLDISTEGRDLSEVERVLHLADDVVRHKTMRLPDAEAARRGLLGEAASATAE